MNKVILKGNLVADPETKTVGSDKSLCKFRVAVNGPKGATYVDIDTWEKTADNCAKFLKKGDPVLIEGRLAQDTWEQDGKKRSKTFVIGERVDFLAKLSAKSETTTSSGPDVAIEDEDDVPF